MYAKYASGWEILYPWQTWTDTVSGKNVLHLWRYKVYVNIRRGSLLRPMKEFQTTVGRSEPAI